MERKNVLQVDAKNDLAGFDLSCLPEEINRKIRKMGIPLQPVQSECFSQFCVVHSRRRLLPSVFLENFLIAQAQIHVQKTQLFSYFGLYNSDFALFSRFLSPLFSVCISQILHYSAQKF